ncbi:hypothetical protein ACWEGE_34705 [Amycolatopsis sp. NPDC004747]
MGEALDRADGDPELIELADRLATYITHLAEQGAGDTDVEPPFAELMDALAFDTAPPARRLIELLRTRGWTGWTKLERVDPAPRDVSDILPGRGSLNGPP